jgi:aryl-alcohol dehydrogenase-like predicted oxidoreductase
LDRRRVVDPEPGGAGGDGVEGGAGTCRQGEPPRCAAANVLAQKPWIVPIPGTTKLHRLEENIAAAQVELGPDELREIEDAQLEAQGHRYLPQQQAMIDR